MLNQARHGLSDIGKWGLVLLGTLVSLLILGVAYRFGLTGQALVNLPTLIVLALAAIVDIKRKTIPDWLTLPGLLWVLVTSMVPGLSRTTDAMLGAAICGGAMLVLAVISRGSIGGGDVKLMAMVGASLGWGWGLAALFLAQVAAAVPAIYLLVTGRKGRRDALPFGAFLATFAILITLAKPL